jgi:hypothetical protein
MEDQKPLPKVKGKGKKQKREASERGKLAKEGSNKSGKK